MNSFDTLTVQNTLMQTQSKRCIGCEKREDAFETTGKENSGK